MLNYNHLYYFHVTATEGSLAAAAAKLGVKQSTVSEQLRSLERTLGKALFDRFKTGMRLTEAGRTAYEHTTAMFRASERLMQALSDEPSSVPLSLRVGMSASVARSTSTDFLLPLFELEDCLLTITTAETVSLLQALRAHDFDLVICESQPTDAALQGLQHAIIAHTPLVAIVAPNANPATDWQDIGLVHYHTSSQLHWDVEAFLEASKLRPHVVGEADDPFLLVEAAARGGHVAIVPRSVARDAVNTGRVRILAQLPTTSAGVHALYPDGETADLARRAVERLIARAKAVE